MMGVVSRSPAPDSFTHRQPTTKQNGGCWAPHAGLLKEPRRLGPGGRWRRRPGGRRKRGGRGGPLSAGIFARGSLGGYLARRPRAGSGVGGVAMSTQVISARPKGGRSGREPPSPQRAPPRADGAVLPQTRGTELCLGLGAALQSLSCQVWRAVGPSGCLRGVLRARGRGSVVPVHVSAVLLTRSSGGLCITGVQYFSRNLIKVLDCFFLKHEGFPVGAFHLVVASSIASGLDEQRPHTVRLNRVAFTSFLIYKGSVKKST